MSFDPVTAAMDLGSKLIDRLIPDPAAKSAATLQLLQMQQTGQLAELTADTTLAQAQDDINKAEAQSGSLFVAGGRPFIIWICGVALGSDFIIRPFAMWLAGIFKLNSDWPALDMQSLLPLLIGMLGLGAMRSYDKKQEAAK